ncbi:MAG: carbohydrate binding domain-containing protein [Bacteroidia bacterium]|nr:carbohydrate binding domain-containing protein [Bacteroidia bacterium]
MYRLLAVLAIAGGLWQQDAAAQNQVINGNFETWPLNGWTLVDAGISLAQETGIVQSGVRSARVTVATTAQADADLRQEITVTAGVSYDVSVRVYQLNNQVRAMLYAGGFTNLYSNPNQPGVWQQINYTFIAAVSGVIEVGLRFYDTGNWVGPTADMLVDNFVMQFSGGVTASQFVFVTPVPANAAAGSPYGFGLGICASDGTEVDVDFTNPISLTNNGSTASYTVLPGNFGQTPTDGCVYFLILPTSTGVINLNVTGGGLPPLSTGSIVVANYASPSAAYSAEIYDTDLQPALNADTLNNAWERLTGDSCVNTSGGIFTPVYGTLAYDDLTHTGSITGLTQMTGGTTGVPYTGTVTFRLMSEQISGSVKGVHFTNGDGALSNNPLVMQQNSPKPAAIAGADHFTENTGDLTTRNGILFTFSQPIASFGLWLGDVETNPYGTNAEILAFYGDAVLSGAPIITSSPLAQQQNIGNAGCGSSSGFPGCGNVATRWVQIAGAPFTDVLILVGDDGVGGTGNTEHLSFGGVSIGGTCSPVVLPVADWGLRASAAGSRIVLEWQQIPEQTQRLLLERSASGSGFSLLDTLDPRMPFLYWDAQPGASWNYYRLVSVDQNGARHYSPAVSAALDPAAGGSVRGYAAGQMLHIEGLALEESGELRVYDASGKLLIRQPVMPGDPDSHRIGLRSLPAGMYVWTLQAGSRHARGKVLYALPTP